MANNDKNTVTKAQAEAHRRVLQQLLRHEDNRRCADCMARGPTWASVNLGVFVCLNCSGIHRSLGTDLSKVRSTTLDTWLPEQVSFVQRMGNRRANLFWEARLPSSFKRPAEGDMLGLRHFINDKYRDQRYANRTWDKPPTIETYLVHPFMEQLDGGGAAQDGRERSSQEDPGRLETAEPRRLTSALSSRKTVDVGNLRAPDSSARFSATKGANPSVSKPPAATPSTPELFDLLSLDEPEANAASAVSNVPDFFSDPGSSVGGTPQAPSAQHRSTLSQESVPETSSDGGWAAFVGGAAPAAEDHWDAFQSGNSNAPTAAATDPFSTPEVLPTAAAPGAPAAAAAPQLKYPSAPSSPTPQQPAQKGPKSRHRPQRSAEEILRMFDQPKPAPAADSSWGGSTLPPMGFPGGMSLPPPPPGMEGFQLPAGAWAAFPMPGDMGFPPTLDASAGLPGNIPGGIDFSSLQGGWATLPGVGHPGMGSGTQTTKGML